MERVLSIKKSTICIPEKPNIRNIVRLFGVFGDGIIFESISKYYYNSPQINQSKLFEPSQNHFNTNGRKII